MSQQRFTIGDQITFTHRGITQTGRIVGTEYVSDWRRRIGQHYVIRTSDYLVIDVHVDQIGGLVGEVAEVA